MWGKKDKRLRSTDCMVNMHVKYGVSLQVNGVGSGELAPLRLRAAERAPQPSDTHRIAFHKHIPSPFSDMEGSRGNGHDQK